MAAAALLPRPPAPWRAYAGLLLRRRKGLGDDRPVPLIGCGTGVIQLDADWLAHYRELIGLPSDEPAVLPPLALQIAAAPLHLEILSDADFPFSSRRLVHVAQRIDQSSPVMPGAALQLDAFTGRSRSIEGGTHFEIVTEARRAGRLVWRSIATILARDRRRDAGDSRASVAPLTLKPGPGWRRLEPIAVDDGLGRRYAVLAVDWNPLQRWPWLARRFGFEHSGIGATWTLARALAQAGWPDHEAYSLQARFLQPLEPPTHLVVRVLDGPSVQSLKVTDRHGDVEYLRARLEAAVGRHG